MAKTRTVNISDYIVPLEMNGLHGRMLRMDAPKNGGREILFVYGHHSSLERWWGVIQDLNKYGAVTVPDLPGFGGMDSLYKIGEKPDIDTLADYLAAFIKLRYKRRRVTIAGLSFGFVIVTRMLQRFPEITKQVNMLVSVVGFAHKDDFSFGKYRLLAYRIASKFFSYRIPAIFFRNVILHPMLIRSTYAKTHNAKKKFKSVSKRRFRSVMDFEVHLWRINDARTHMYTTHEFLNVDNCKWRVELPVHHVSVKSDRYFDNHMVEQHMRVIFDDFFEYKSRMNSHAPSIIADVKTASPLFPNALRKYLEQT